MEEVIVLACSLHLAWKEGKKGGRVERKEEGRCFQ